MRNSERLNAAIRKAIDDFGLECIYEAHEAHGFVEVIGEIGGDVRKLRFYDDGNIGG